MTKKVKIRVDRIMILVAILVAIIVGIIGVTRDIKLKNSVDYKLGELGYSKKEVETIINNTKEKELQVILKRKYHKSIPELLKQKYLKFEDLEKYLTYKDDHKNEKLKNVVSIVNAGADHEFYTNIQKTDVSKNETLLVNKYYQLEKDYKPDDIKECSSMYAYADNSLRNDAYNAFKELFNAAKREGQTIIINSSYRDYGWQEYLYNSYHASSGEEYADSVAARPGHSEHQTGLAIDVATYDTPLAKFEETEAFTWMKENSYKYGFILRYPKGKEQITGYDYEPWHYRYVGKKVAQDIHEKDITFDEYYEYYLK